MSSSERLQRRYEHVHYRIEHVRCESFIYPNRRRTPRAAGDGVEQNPHWPDGSKLYFRYGLFYRFHGLKLPGRPIRRSGFSIRQNFQST